MLSNLEFTKECDHSQKVKNQVQTWVPAQGHTGTTEGGAYGDDGELDIRERRRVVHMGMTGGGAYGNAGRVGLTRTTGGWGLRERRFFGFLRSFDDCLTAVTTVSPRLHHCFTRHVPAAVSRRLFTYKGCLPAQQRVRRPAAPENSSAPSTGDARNSASMNVERPGPL